MKKLKSESDRCQGYLIRIEKDGSITLRVPSDRAISWSAGQNLGAWIKAFGSKGAIVDMSRLRMIKNREACFVICRELRDAPEYRTTEPASLTSVDQTNFGFD